MSVLVRNRKENVIDKRVTSYYNSREAKEKVCAGQQQLIIQEKIMKFKSLVTNHIPNGITIIRIILTALLVFLFANGYEQVEIVIVITLLIFISDLVDGKIARKLKATSKVGEF